MPASHYPLSVPSSFSVLLMLFTLPRIMLVARSSSSCRNALVAPLLQHMLLGVEVQQVLFQVACRLFLMSHSQQAETMAILTTAVVLITVTIPHRKLMVSHTLLKAKFLINNLLYQCTMVARPRLDDMEVLDRSNRNNLTSVVLNRMLVHQLSQCKAWFLASH